ncbi:MAG: hypothetical protein RXR03_08050 [Thermocladium sp.]
MIKKYYVLYANNSLMLRYEITAGEGDLELKDVIRHVINIDSSELGRIQEFEREAEEKEKELEGKALELRKITQELEKKGYGLAYICKDDDDDC